MKRFKKRVYIAIAISLLYIIIGAVTLNDYGVSWDEPTHFKRGQAYLHYFLTGEKNYGGLKLYNLEEAKQNPNYHERSFYQNDIQNGNYYLQEDGGHPPLNGILASVFNLFFYQIIPIMGDVESYHFFEIVVSGIVVGVIFIFASEVVSIWAGLFSMIFFAAYPLFWAESHFNIKDPIETAFFTFTIFSLWFAFTKKDYKWILLAAICAGFALGTKFNIIFLPFIIVPWIIFNYFNRSGELLEFLRNRKIVISLIAFPIIMFFIFFASWPYLWHNTIARIFSIATYYMEIGTEADLTQQIVSDNWNFYAIKWIIASTPIVTIIFGFLGIISFKKWIGKQNNFVILWLLWLIVPIFRVSFPGTSIYGGVRQLMEYIPALALITGLGAESVRVILFEKNNLFRMNNRICSSVLLVIVAVAAVFPLLKTHPNENVYFNHIFGGLSVLMSSGFPAAGNSFGNTYKQGLDWLIDNAADGSQLALIQGTSLNIPLYKVPPKIRFSNSYFSGIEKKGEYLMEVTYNAEVRVYFYDWEYVEKILEPVYEVKVDGASILKVWKNDLDHTKPEYRARELPYNKNVPFNVDENTLTINLPKIVTLSRLILSYQDDGNCQIVKDGFIESSLDNKNWFRERDPIGVPQMPNIKGVNDNTIKYFFAARRAKVIKLIFGKNSCALLKPRVEIVILE